MSVPVRILVTLEMLLRVPLLIVIDEFFRYNFGYGTDTFFLKEYGTGGLFSRNVTIQANSSNAAIAFKNYVSSHKSPFHFVTLFVVNLERLIIIGLKFRKTEIEAFQHNHSDYFNTLHYINQEQTLLMKIFSISLFLQLLAAVFILFLLPIRTLMSIYCSLVACMTIYLSFQISSFSIRSSSSVPISVSSVARFLLNFSVRGILAAFYFATRPMPVISKFQAQRSSWSIFGTLTAQYIIDPLLLSMFFVTGFLKINAIFFIVLITILQVSLWIPQVSKVFASMSNQTKCRENPYGFKILDVREVKRIRFKVVFRAFWICRACYSFCSVYFVSNSVLSFEDAGKYMVLQGTDTFVGIAGLSLTISAFTVQLGNFLIWILFRGTNREFGKNIFGHSAFLFFMYCFQTSITELDPDSRFDRLVKITIALGIAFFHMIHHLVSPLLEDFQRLQLIQKRAILCGIISVFLSSWISIAVIETYELSTWLVAIIALALEFQVEMAISLLISLAIYYDQVKENPPRCLRNIGLFVLRMDQFDIDDIIFHLKVVSNCTKYLVGIYLFLNGYWILLFESAAIIRILGTCIHAYFNIFSKGKDGLQILTLRRTAQLKIESLADASEEQLEAKKDDVCAICQEKMETAKVTKCSHLFHSNCLRKWISVKDKCPLCERFLFCK